MHLIALPEGHPARYGINPSNILNDVKNKNYSELNRAISILSKKEASFFTGSKEVYLQFMPIFNKAFNRNVIDSDILRKIVNCCQEAGVFSVGELKKNVLIKLVYISNFY